MLTSEIVAKEIELSIKQQDQLTRLLKDFKFLQLWLVLLFL